MARKPVLIRPILVFLECSQKIIEKVGNDNDFSEFIYGTRPIAISLSREQLGWGARTTLGDNYGLFLKLMFDTSAQTQGLDPATDPNWRLNVKLVVFGPSFDPIEGGVRELFKHKDGLFSKANFFKSDQWGNMDKLWGAGRPKKNPTQAAGDPNPPDHPLLNFDISELELGVRAFNCVKRVGIETVGDLVRKSAFDLSAIPNLGKRSIDEIIEALATHGLALQPDPEL